MVIHGELLVRTEVYYEAEKMYHQALVGYEEVLGPKHTFTLDTVNNLGVLYKERGKLDKAEEMLLQALRGREEEFGSELVSTHIFALETMKALGDLYSKMKTRPDESRAMYEKALAGFTKARGPLADVCVIINQCIEKLGPVQLRDVSLPESSVISEGGSQPTSPNQRKES